jgi:hypothetical protein
MELLFLLQNSSFGLHFSIIQLDLPASCHLPALAPRARAALTRGAVRACVVALL